MSINRYTEPGWKLLAMADPSLRRGLWVRQSEGAVELCAGREGDDAYVRIENPTRELMEVLSAARWAMEMRIDEVLIPEVLHALSGDDERREEVLDLLSRKG